MYHMMHENYFVGRPPLASLHLDPYLHLADRHYQDALQSDPSDEFSLFLYGEFLSEKQHYHEAVEHLLKLLTINPRFSGGAGSLARACLDQLGLTNASLMLNKFTKSVDLNSSKLTISMKKT